MNPENTASNEDIGIINEIDFENSNISSEFAQALVELRVVCDNVFMNLDECFDIPKIADNVFLCQNYVNQWILSEFFLMDSKAFSSEEVTKKFIEETICKWYWVLVQAQVYDRNSKEREECYLVAIFIFSKIFEVVKNITKVDLLRDSIIDGMVFAKIHRKIEKRWNEICNEIMILESIMRANFVIKAVSTIRNGFMKLSIEGELPVLLMKNATVYINASYSSEVLNDIRRLCKVKYVDFLTDKSVFAENMFEENMLVEYAILFDDSDIIDDELQKLDDERENIMTEMQRVNFLLSNSTFVEKAPQDKLRIEEQKYQYYTKRFEKLNKIEGYLKKFLVKEISI